MVKAEWQSMASLKLGLNHPTRRHTRVHILQSKNQGELKIHVTYLHSEPLKVR